MSTNKKSAPKSGDAVMTGRESIDWGSSEGIDWGSEGSECIDTSRPQVDIVAKDQFQSNNISAIGKVIKGMLSSVRKSHEPSCGANDLFEKRQVTPLEHPKPMTSLIQAANIEAENKSASPVHLSLEPDGVSYSCEMSIDKLTEERKRLIDNADKIVLSMSETLKDEKWRNLPARVEFLSHDYEDIWFVGDIHGDFVAMKAALSTINALGKPKRLVVFLGDLIDRGLESQLVILQAFEMQSSVPSEQKVMFLAGNHDECLCGGGDTPFSSTVDPAEFAVWLNEDERKEWEKRAGATFVEWIQKVPRAIFLSCGLMVAHAGVPLSDVHDQIVNFDSLSKSSCLQDFVWTRAHPTKKKVYPNRHTKGSSFGFENFDAFCDRLKGINYPAWGLVRGHDHDHMTGNARYQVLVNYANHPIVTITTLSEKQDGEVMDCEETVPCIGRLSMSDSKLSIYKMLLPTDLVQSYKNRFLFNEKMRTTLFQGDSKSGSP